MFIHFVAFSFTVSAVRAALCGRIAERVLFTVEKKFPEARQEREGGQEGLFARTAYPHP